jgi:hypothetical protein
MRWPWTTKAADQSGEKADYPPYDPALEPPPLGDILRRGMAAQRLLGDPTLAEAFEAVRRDNYAAWLISDSPELCDSLHREARALDRVAAKLRGYIGAAKLRATQDEAA